MKKILLAGMMMLVALTIRAQIKVAPKMQKGDKKVYVTEVSIVAAQVKMNATTETVYEVKDVTTDGYVIDAYVSDCKVEGDTANLANRIGAMAMEMTKGLHALYSTDKDGQILKILNHDEMLEAADKMLDKTLSDINLPAMMTKEKIKMAAKMNISEENMLANAKMSDSPFSLNGKTITNGMEDTFSTKEGLKLKRTFTLADDGSVKTDAEMDMNVEDIIGMISKQAGQMSPETANSDALKQQITQMINSGMLKFTATNNATYTFCPDGWVKTLISDYSFQIMGQTLESHCKITLKQ